MDLRIENKVALVTAASKGLGKAVAERLTQEGAKVIICSRNLESLKLAKKEIFNQTGKEIFYAVCDVTKEDQIKKMIQQIIIDHGKIDILVTNAGGPPSGGFGAFTIDDYRNALELNLLSTIMLSKSVTPYMKKQNWGRIIMITSISVKQPIDSLILSNTSRTGVIGFMKSLSNSVAKDGITVNAICPGYTRTQRVENLARTFAENNNSTEEAFYNKLESDIPMGRIGSTNEFAQSVAFLASEGAVYVTGVSLKVDGGFSKGLF